MRTLKYLGFSLLAIGVLLAAVFLWYRQASQPLTEGTVRVTGPAARIQIRRSEHGVPTIIASSEVDAAFGLGFAHAQDRLWQMEFNRRLASGQLAEILGPSALPTDQFLRTLGVHRAAEQIYRNLATDDRAFVDAYVAGVNAQFESRTGPLPPEFLLTGAARPSSWTAADSIAWSLMMAWDLSSYAMRMELRRLRLSRTFTMAEINDFFPPLAGEKPPPSADYVDLYRLLGLRSVATTEDPTRLLAQLPSAGFGDNESVGSNNWVVAGSRTTSGKPIVANDPHLGLTAPSVWYFASLSAPGLDVTGATLPGVPGVVIGRNRHVAWGFTNTGADQQDLYLERLHPDDASRYETPDGWSAFAARTERFKVKGQEDVELVVRESRHGPVLSGLESIDKSFLHPRYVLALRWSALEPEDSTVPAIRSMNRAKNAAEFIRAVAGFQVVTQSVVYADVDGAIGFAVAGRIPVRAPENGLLGIVPAPGWEARYDWLGYLPFASNPRIENPASGWLATANNRIAPPGYAHHLTYDWFAAYRLRRIEQLLDAKSKHDIASMHAMQADVVSLAAREFMTLLQPVQPLTNAGQEALVRLKAWDGSMAVDRPEPLIFHAWMLELKQRVFADDLGPLAPEFVESADLTRALVRVLRGESTSRDWCDDRTTLERFESCLGLAAEALDVAVERLARATGRDVAGLRWGEAHLAVGEHRPVSNVPLVREFFELTTPYPGDTFTLNVGALSHRPTAPFTTRHAASLRAIMDLADPDASSLWIHSTGQSGNPFSSQYASMQPLWRDVQYLPMRGERAGALLEINPR